MTYQVDFLPSPASEKMEKLNLLRDVEEVNEHHPAGGIYAGDVDDNVHITWLDDDIVDGRCEDRLTIVGWWVEEAIPEPQPASLSEIHELVGRIRAARQRRDFAAARRTTARLIARLNWITSLSGAPAEVAQFAAELAHYINRQINDPEPVLARIERTLPLPSLPQDESDRQGGHK